MEFKNEKYNRRGTIDCEINHPVYGWLPTTLSPDDPETAEMYALVAAGEVAAYVPPVVSVDNLRKFKKEEIVMAYEEAMQELVKDYPLKERETWRKQEEQARAYLEDNATSTPGLDALALSSGRDKDDLVSAIISKADALLVATLTLTGKKQALITQIDNVSTLTDEDAARLELESISW